MSGYIVCQSASMFLEPATGRAPMHHYRRPWHLQRHRPDDGRYVRLAIPHQHGHCLPRNHHRSGNFGRPPAFHHQHPAGDYSEVYYHHPLPIQPLQQLQQLPTMWYTNGHHYPELLRLHEEIVAFYKDMRPRPEERQMRKDVVRRITDAIRNRWPSTHVEVFGSMKTGLYLPTSDIDLVVFHTMDRTPFHEIRDELIARGICTDRTIKVLDSASVPIIKLTDQLSQVRVDIGFNIGNSQRSAELVQAYVQQYPALPYLVIVLKQFLYQQELNEVYSGGISSYSLVLLTISFLQSRAFAGRGGSLGANYGVLLLEFFQLYSRLFQYQRVVVSVTRAGGLQVKPWMDSARQPSLSIEDPLCSENDVARGSYNVSRVQAAFAGALRQLTEEISRPIYVCPSPKGMLSSVVRVPAEIERYRSWIQARFPVSPVVNNRATSPMPDREPYEVSSSSSGISSSSPEPRASISCSDSMATSDPETDDEPPSESAYGVDLLADQSDELVANNLKSANVHPLAVDSLNVISSSSPIISQHGSAQTSSFTVFNIEAEDMHGADILEDYEEVDLEFDGSLFVGRGYKENPMAYDDVGSVVPVNKKRLTVHSNDVSDASPVDLCDELLIANFTDISLAENSSSAFAVEFDGYTLKDDGVCSDMNDVRRRQLICCSDDIESGNSVNIKACEKSFSCEHSKSSPCIKNPAVIRKFHTDIDSLEASDIDCRPSVECMKQDACVPCPVDRDCAIRPPKSNDSCLSMSNRLPTICNSDNELLNDRMLLTSVDELPCISSNENMLYCDRQLLQSRPSNR